jgi:hypothetical protein
MPAKNNTPVRIADFSGGMNTSDSEFSVPPNQHTLIKNMLPEGGELKPIWGKEAVSSASGAVKFDAVYDWTKTLNGATVTRRIAIKGDTVYYETSTPNTYQVLYMATEDPNFVSTGQPWKGSIVEYNGYLYITGLGRKVTSGSTNGYGPIVWDGNIQDNLTVTSISGNVITQSGSMATWVGMGTRIIITDGVHTEMRTNMMYASSLTCDTALDNTYAAGSQLILSNIYYAGIDVPTLPANVNAVSGTGLEIGVYRYKFVYKNIARGVTSNATAAMTVTTTSLNKKVLIETNDSNTNVDYYGAKAFGLYQADKLQIWRTLVGGSTYYLHSELQRTELSHLHTIGHIFAWQTYDTTPDATLATSTVWSARDNENHDPAPELEYLRLYNDRLWGWRKFATGELRCSNTINVEYWPVFNVSATDPSNIIASAGTSFVIGSAGNPITDMVPESAAFGTTGRTGSSLLVFTKNFAKRIYGYDLSDISVDEAFTPGCIANNCAQNYRGIIIFPSRFGIMAVSSGAHDPRIVSKPIRDTLKSYGNVNGEAAWANACATVWLDYYIITAPIQDGTMTPFCCYLGADEMGRTRFAWTQADGVLNARWYHVSTKANNAGSYGGANDLLYCDTATSNTIYRVAPWLYTLAGSAIPITYRDTLANISAPENDKDGIILRRMVFTVQTDATSNISLTLKLWKLGVLATDSPDGNPATTKSLTMTCAASRFINAPQQVVFENLELLCKWPMFELTANVSNDFRIKRVLLEFSNHGNV